MNRMLRDIEEFHQVFGLAYDGAPRTLPPNLSEFRQNFLVEELREYVYSVQDGDLEAQLDALVDLVYVALGTAYLQGLPFQEAWTEIHNSNMRKKRALRPSDSKRDTIYDVVKPIDWVPPNLRRVLKDAQSRTSDERTLGDA